MSETLSKLVSYAVIESSAESLSKLVAYAVILPPPPPPPPPVIAGQFPAWRRRRFAVI
jgi:hypothetical protein